MNKHYLHKNEFIVCQDLCMEQIVSCLVSTQHLTCQMIPFPPALMSFG